MNFTQLMDVPPAFYFLAESDRRFTIFALCGPTKEGMYTLLFLFPWLDLYADYLK